MNEMSLPWFTDFKTIFFVFLIFLLIFHILFIKIFQFSSIAWKRIDYIWLSMAFFGMLSSVGSGREVVSKNMLELERNWLNSQRELIVDNLKSGTSIAVCRQFIQSQYSPPPDEFKKMQMEYDAQCEWFKNSHTRFQALQNDSNDLDLHTLFGVYPAGGEQDRYKSLLDLVNKYNLQLNSVKNLEVSARTTDFELFVRLLGPAFLAIALAMRMTKVTAEVISEKAKK